ncbi:hypothetical protein [Lewinella cohaerens]|uniref:hypothetical protein n=1 Tax=Lewinella cohaerens TaxID=70995 RepID=UPI00036A7222|nr:hypothetical protein [Lewinella cohaerens]
MEHLFLFLAIITVSFGLYWVIRILSSTLTKVKNRNQILLFASLFFVLSSCIKGPNIQSAITLTSLPPDTGPRILDQDLNKKLHIFYTDSIALSDTSFAKRDRRSPVLLASKNRYDYYQVIHFKDDQDVLIENFRQKLLRLLATQTFHQQMDSLQIQLVTTEAIIPYFDGNEMVPINDQRLRSGVNRRFQVIGPSRVNLEIEYTCYAFGKVLRRSKSVRQIVAASQIGKKVKGSRNEIIQAHMTECNSLMNDLIQQISSELVNELKYSFRR